MTSCEHSRWPVSCINVKNNTILRKTLYQWFAEFLRIQRCFRTSGFFSARKWCFLSTRISRHPRFAQSQMRRCVFHYNVVPKKAWIFLRTWNVLRWKKNVSCYSLRRSTTPSVRQGRPTQNQICVSLQIVDQSRIFCKKVAFRNTLLIREPGKATNAVPVHTCAMQWYARTCNISCSLPFPLICHAMNCNDVY